MSSEAFWSVCSMPIGLLLCFFPVLIAWVMAGRKGSNQTNSPKR